MLSLHQPPFRWRSASGAAAEVRATQQAPTPDEWAPQRHAAIRASVKSLHVLLAINEADVLERLAVALIHAGHEVGTARDGQQAIERSQVAQPDVVVLEAALPRGGGLQVCRHIRERSHTPIVLLVGDAVDEDTILHGLQLGADEVIRSSQSPRLIVAQMEAVVRRGILASTPSESTLLQVSDLMLDLLTHQVFKGGAAIRLTRLEFRLLWLLLATPGQVVPYARLVHDAWGYTDEPTPHLLKAHMSRLRRKLGLDRVGGVTIESILGIGYRLTQTAPCNAAMPVATDLIVPDRP